MMNAALVALMALVAAQSANAATVGDLVRGITQSCPDAAQALSSPDFSTLQALLTAAADVPVPDVTGKKEVVIAPTNAAFSDLLESAGLTADQFVASDLFQPTLLAHIGVASNNGASTAGTLTGSLLRLFAGNTTALETVVKQPLMSLPQGVSQTPLTVQGPMNKIPISSVVNCGGNKYILVADGVIKPKAAGSTKGPAAAPISDILAVLAPEASAEEPMPAEMPLDPIMVMTPMPAEEPAVATVPTVDVVPEPVPAVALPPMTPKPVVTAGASYVKAAAVSAAALVAAAFM